MAQQWKRSEIGYTGASFPLRLAPSGKIEISTASFESGNIQHIAEAIVQIIRTIKGERFFRRGFGAAPIHAIFRPNTETEILWMASEIQDIFDEYEPRVTLIECKVVTQDAEQGFVKLQLGFRHNKTQIVSHIEVQV